MAADWLLPFSPTDKKKTIQASTLGLMSSIGGGGGGNPGMSASQIYADLTRQQWQNYVSAYMPIENKIINYAMDSSQPQKTAEQASADVQTSFAQQQAATQRQLKGMGVTLSADEQAAATRQSDLAKSLADVNAQNVAREQTKAMQQSILGNPAPTGLLNKQGV